MVSTQDFTNIFLCEALTDDVIISHWMGQEEHIIVVALTLPANYLLYGHAILGVVKVDLTIILVLSIHGY